MTRSWIHSLAKYVFCFAMTGAAVSELGQSAVVLDSMTAIGVPQRLLFLLAPLKLAGVLTLLFASDKRAREWAYAGFFFNLLGAVYLLITAGRTILPDLIIAPVYLALWVIAYRTYRLTQRSERPNLFESSTKS
jgi:hypothetical protein